MRTLVNLEKLNLSNTNVRDVSALVGMNELVDLDLSFSQVEDVTPLIPLKSLKTLNVFGVGGLDVKELSKQRKGLKILGAR